MYKPCELCFISKIFDNKIASYVLTPKHQNTFYKIYAHKLVLSMLQANSADNKLMIFFLFFWENRIWFHANLLLSAKSYFLRKIKKKNISKCRLLRFLPSMLSVKKCHMIDILSLNCTQVLISDIWYKDSRVKIILITLTDMLFSPQKCGTLLHCWYDLVILIFLLIVKQQKILSKYTDHCVKLFIYKLFLFIVCSGAERKPFHQNYSV